MRKNKFYALFLSGLCCLALLNGCASKDKEGSGPQEQHASEESNVSDNSVGEFSMQDIEGETYTQEMFADHDLTMVNVFTTWCTPCVNEIPDLQTLWENQKEQGVNVVGIVLDSIDSNGAADQEIIEKAKVLAERTGAAYPFLIPDQSYLNGRLSGINAVPETFFVDKDGNIVGETYSGSRSLEDWETIVAALKQETAQ